MKPHEQLTPIEARILAVLIEKAATTPDGYPLSSNALVAACNQATNRDPVTAFTEREVDQTMMELRQRGLARTVSGDGHRVSKHRHVVGEALGIDDVELAVLAVLLLRGAQTLKEIATRTSRYAGGPDGSVEAVEAALERLAGRDDPLIVRLDRRPGEREPRIDQLWARSEASTPPTPAADEPHAPSGPDAPGPDRVRELEIQVAALTDRIARLEAELGFENT